MLAAHVVDPPACFHFWLLKGSYFFRPDSASGFLSLSAVHPATQQFLVIFCFFFCRLKWKGGIFKQSKEGDDWTGCTTDMSQQEKLAMCKFPVVTWQNVCCKTSILFPPRVWVGFDCALSVTNLLLWTRGRLLRGRSPSSSVCRACAPSDRRFDSRLWPFAAKNLVISNSHPQYCSLTIPGCLSCLEALSLSLSFFSFLLSYLYYLWG